MVAQDPQMIQRDKEMQRLYLLADPYVMQHGRFPSKVRIGLNVARRLFPPDSSMAVTPDFVIEKDDTLYPEEVAFDS